MLYENVYYYLYDRRATADAESHCLDWIPNKTENFVEVVYFQFSA